MTGTHSVLTADLVLDDPSPVAAYRRLSAEFPGPGIIAEPGGNAGEGQGGGVAFVGLAPDLVWRCRGGHAELSLGSPGAFAPCPDGTIESLRRIAAESRLAGLPPGLDPAAAGLWGYLGYDAVRLLYSLPGDGPPDPIGIPDGMFMRSSVVLVLDTASGRATVAAPIRPGSSAAAAAGRLARAATALRSPVPAVARRTARADAAPAAALQPTMTREAFGAMAARAQQAVRAGALRQAGVSQRFAAPFLPAASDLYDALRRGGPAALLFCLEFGDFALVGASPCLLAEVTAGRDGSADRRMRVRPIGGTRPRGASPDEDERLAVDLLASAKETGEHLMLLDAGREEVASVARPDTVEVTERLAVRRFPAVMHLRSAVEGALRADRDALDALLAAFPAATVVGVPKRPALELVDAVEPVRRSFYGGAVVCFAADGGMASHIAIRTALLKDGVLHAQAGAGIVAGSDADAEYQETMRKAQGLMRAAADAVLAAQRR
ncbi:MAG TPA: chorismate-binding protein [Stellaceae bacterium]